MSDLASDAVTFGGSTSVESPPFEEQIGTTYTVVAAGSSSRAPVVTVIPPPSDQDRPADIIEWLNSPDSRTYAREWVVLNSEVDVLAHAESPTELPKDLIVGTGNSVLFVVPHGMRLKR